MNTHENKKAKLVALKLGGKKVKLVALKFRGGLHLGASSFKLIEEKRERD